MTLKDAIKSSLTILKQVMEEKLNATNIEVWFFHVIHTIILVQCRISRPHTSLLSLQLATVEPGKTFHMFSKEELEDVIKDI